MKLGRMIYNDKRQVPFEDELNRFIRTEVTENPCLSNLVSGVSGANGRISMNFSRYWEDLREEFQTREWKNNVKRLFVISTQFEKLMSFVEIFKNL